MRRRLGRLGVIALLAGAVGLAALVAVSPAFRSPPIRGIPPDGTDIALLARDVHLRIGGVPLVLPLAALPQQARYETFRADKGEDGRQAESAARAAFAEQAADPASPLDQTRVDLLFRAWSWQDTSAAHWARLCPALSRNWAQSICDDAFAPLLQSLPGRITLADARRLDAFKDTFLSVGNFGNAAPLLQSLDLRLGQPALRCRTPSDAGEPRPCLAALRITADLVAVWFVQDGPGEPASTQARREGQALAALVAFGLGQAEDYPALTAAACATLRPDAGPFQGKGVSDWPCSL